MWNALRIFSAAFIIVEAGALFSTFALESYWPDPAVDYWQWQAAQPLITAVVPLAYIGLALAGVSWLSAIALLFRLLVARWVFAVSIALALVTEAIIAFNVPPQLVGADYLLNEFALLLAGIVGTLAFCIAGKDRDGAP